MIALIVAKTLPGVQQPESRQLFNLLGEHLLVLAPCGVHAYFDPVL